MSSIGEMASRAQDFVTAMAGAPQPDETPFVRNSRPFVIIVAILALAGMGVIVAWFHDTASIMAVSAILGAVIRELARFRSQDKQTAANADVENRKTVTAAATADKQTAAIAAEGDKP